jgi:sigma-B regulation protein RsbU (phosphoserine phosphatase)
MKASLQIKFFVVLVAFSLLPLFVSRTVTSNTAQSMTDALSATTRSELLAIVTAELEHSAMSILRTVEGNGRALRLGSRNLAQQAERVLNGPFPGTDGQNRRADDTSDWILSDREAMPMDHPNRKSRRGAARELPVTLDHPVFRLAPGVTPQTVRSQTDRLRGLLPVLTDLHAELASIMTWAQVTLDSGVLLSYPGHGGYPRMYDPRKQPWYTRIRELGDCTWTLPLMDPTTKRVVGTVGCPIRDAAGTMIGVASLDVPIQDMLDETDLKSRWSNDIRSFMVSRSPDGGLLILARQAYEKTAHHWKAGIEPELMTSDDPKGIQRLTEAMDAAEGGSLQLPFEGEPCVWAFASNQDFSFLLVVPERVVTHLPDDVAGSLTNLFLRIKELSAFISIIMLVVTGVIAWVGSRTFTRSMVAMADAARRLARGDFSVRITTRTGDERDVLADAFNDMVPRLQEHVRISRDLELAQGVQHLLLPGAVPDLPGYDLAGGITYCDQTGGDYYDFIDMRSQDGHSLSVILGDVSGHGVPSALIMASVRGQIHSLADVAMPPEERLTTINARLSRDLDGTGRFLTLFYLELAADSGAASWVRAGHDPAIRYTPESDRFGQLSGEGIPLGVLGEYRYEANATVLARGEVLVLATDGVWEARDETGAMFGKERILAIVRENAHNRAEAIRIAIMEAVDLHQAGVQEDDIAVVVIKRV